MTEEWKQWEGQVVDGEFRLGRTLSGSAHGAVFLTESGGKEPRPAAIKLVLDEPEPEQWLRSNWGAIADLSHPNLMRLYRTGRCQLGMRTALYVVMEGAELDLSQVISQRPLTAEETQEMAVPLVQALAYLHGKGWTHGRLKPANILSVDEQLRISADGLSRTGETGGVHRPLTVYDAPEIEGGALSPAADVWAVGMLLAEVLTGNRPLWERREAPVAPDMLPEPFQEIVRGCLDADPLRRWSVAQIGARLGAALSAPAARAVAAPPRSSLTPRRRYLVPAALAAAVVVVFAGARMLIRNPPSEPQSAPAASKTAATSPAVSTPPAPAPAPAPAVPSTPPAEPPRKAASHSVSGKVEAQVLPNVPAKARGTIQGTVRVRIGVRVDPSGRVQDAKIESAKSSRYFANLALPSARKWKFAAPEIDGRKVASSWTLQFEFTRTATRAHATRAR